MTEPVVSPSAADRNLLFGILALQLDFLDRDELIAGMNAWLLDKGKPLGQIFNERGILSADHRGLLDSLVDEHLRQHGNDPRRCLEAIAANSTVTDALNVISDPDVQSTLSVLDSGAAPRNGRAIRAAGRNRSRYRRLRAHARGGLGQVFVAEDTELNREVAVKEIQPERADDPSSRRRFLLEAEITGALEHPGIVPVYGLGTYDDGRPYYAMRFIRGESLKQAIDQFHAHDWSTRPVAERMSALRPLLRRLIDMCNAVAYAHSRGVLHRDLKPHNVMLGKFGETLVLDWGLAKAGIEAKRSDPDRDMTTDPMVRPSSASDIAGTLAGSALGTPGYMSPEQEAGRHDELTPASDVYSLGVTLHVLLTGRRPSDPTDTRAGIDRVRDEAAGPGRDRWAPAPLLAICRKATAERPDERYRSPLELAADVERWLADEPVAVYQDPWLVRAVRWARQRRTGVAAGIVLLVTSLAASAIGTGLLWREERKTAEQKRVAEENYELARDLSYSGIDLIESSEAYFAADPARHAARKETLTAAVKAFGKYIEREPDDPELRRRTARVYRFAGNVHRLEREHRVAELLYADAVRILEKLAADYPDELEHRRRLSETLRDQAKVQSTLGQLAAAASTLERSIEVAEALRLQDADQPNDRRILAVALLNLSNVQLTRGQLREATITAGRSAELFRALIAATDSAHPYDPLLLAGALNVMAVVERESGRPDAARPIHLEAIKHLDSVKAKPPEGVNVADVLHFLAWCRLEQCRTSALAPKRRAAAETNLGAVARQWEELSKVNTRIPMYRDSLGVAYQERGRLRAEDGRRDEARADFETSRKLLEAEVERSPDMPGLRGDLGRTYLGLARVARGDGDMTVADKWYRQAEEALAAANEGGPENAKDRRDRDTVRTEQNAPARPMERD